MADIIMKKPGMNSISRKKILHEISAILKPWIKHARLDDPVPENVHVINDLGLDSVGILHLIMEAEKKYGITIENYDLDMQVLSQLGNLIDLIEGKINETL